ncbi:MAG: RluA family pseudouridine synthase [Lachnospiraceae bacterium]|nr:RluA family pseudouridine synthase [Lachnospiraceae bacterium]
MKTQIIYEDNEILVIYKPGGFPAQSARVTQPDVVSEICGYLKSPYVGLVHRLDQPVEGLMVLGKTKEATAHLSRQMMDGSFQKTYLAVVRDETVDGCLNEGKEFSPDKGWTELTDYLIKDGKAGKAQVVTGQQAEKVSEAKLLYRRLNVSKDSHRQGDAENNDTALLEVKLVTGRFHQIRAQMSNAKMPLLGDMKYGSETSQELSKQKQIKDVALCAYKLSFPHPKTKKRMEFEIKPKKPVFNSYGF